MGTRGIALLGPVAVNGDSAALPPRDRVVLAALAVRPGDIVGADRLADMMWPGGRPASWKKIVQGCILRLRHVLGSDAIETTRYGYRLTVPAQDVDARQFEDLLARGRELLTVGQPERAHHTLQDALGLWRGVPLIDVQSTEQGRIEAARLTELRLQAQECRLEAALQAGLHAEVVAEGQAAVAREPLREQRWALLARALYQAGRQADALGTVQRARTVLAAELGLDPGPDLVAREQSILRQDPGLTVGAAVPDAAAVCPYLGLLPYDVGDAEMFYGRDEQVAHCLRRLESAGVLAVVGPSGSGKSSLLRAGVAAELARAGRRPSVVTPGSRPTTLLAEGTREGGVLVVDQFEEVFTACTDSRERAAFLAGLVAEAATCPVVISMRVDRLGAAAGYPPLARLIEQGLYLLGPMDENDLRAAITGPAQAAGLLLEPGLVDLLVREVENQPGALPLLSHALRRTWERREGRTLTIAGYQCTGGIRGCVAQSAEQLYESLTTRQRPVLRQVLLRLVSAGDDGDPVRNRVNRRSLLTDPDRETIVEDLIRARLVTMDRDTVQIAHESLTSAWPRLSAWLDEDVEGQRILRHLSTSADAWDAMGRPDSELYRGSRLRQALEWQHNRVQQREDSTTGPSDPELTRVESDFLRAAAAVRAIDERLAMEQSRRQGQTRRRTRLLITGLAMMLATALVAGLLAVRQQREREAADLAAAVAEATRIDNASRTSTGFGTAMLLALEANHIQDSPDTRGVVTDLLTSHPALIRTLAIDSPVESLAVSPDGRSLLVGHYDHTSTYRTDTLTRTAISPIDGSTLEYRADGRQVLMLGQRAVGLDEGANTVSAAVTDPQLKRLRFLPVAGLRGTWIFGDDARYSADGRSLALYAAGYSYTSAKIVDANVTVWDVGNLARPIRTVHPMFAFAVALSPDGKVLYVGTRRPSLEAIDVRTGRTVRSVPLSVAMALSPVPPDVDASPTPTGVDATSSIWEGLSDDLELSPDGKTLAVAEVNDVVLFDTATLTERMRLRGHTDLVRSLQFSHDGHLVAAAGEDNIALVWDVSTGEMIGRLTGHSGPVTAVAFSADDTTIYTGGLDQRVMVWDLAGRRQFAARLVDGEPRARIAGVALPAPDGQAVVFAGSTASSDHLQLLDVAAQRPQPVANDPESDPLAAWIPPDDHLVVTAAGSVLQVRDRATGRTVVKRIVSNSQITAVAATPDGRFIIAGDQSGAVRRVEVGTLQPAGPTVQLDHAVKAISTGESNTAVAVLDDNSYSVVDLAGGTELHRHTLGFPGTAAAVSPDGGRLAVGGSSGQVGLLDVDSGHWLSAPVVAHRQYVDAVSFAADGHTVVTSSFDGGVRFWNGNDGTPIAGLRVGQDESPADATMTPDGHTAIVATTDGAVYRVDSRFDQVIGYACRIVGPNLSAAEWRKNFGDEPYHHTCPDQ